MFQHHYSYRRYPPTPPKPAVVAVLRFLQASLPDCMTIISCNTLKETNMNGDEEHRRERAPSISVQVAASASSSGRPRELTEKRLMEALKKERAIIGDHLGPLAYQCGRENDRISKRYFKAREEKVSNVFPGCMGMDNFMWRAESVMGSRGFAEHNTIAMSITCRDEVCWEMKRRVEEVFGPCFRTAALGSAVMLGREGMKAFMSHSPTVDIDGSAEKEQYAFFGFTHIAVDAEGNIGAIQREGRATCSAACGAIKGALGLIQKEASEKSDSQAWSKQEKIEIDRLDPEFSYLYSRLKTELEVESPEKLQGLDLVELTKVADTVLRKDLNELIAVTVDPENANYCVVTGIHIHSWPTDYYSPEPKLEYVWPTSFYTVVLGERMEHSVQEIPAPTPRQLKAAALYTRSAAPKA